MLYKVMYIMYYILHSLYTFSLVQEKCGMIPLSFNLLQNISASF